MKRREMRELAFKTIYSRFFNPDEQDIYKTADKDGLEFTNKILSAFAEHYTEVNEIISNHLKGYTIDRLYRIDLAILVLAIVELKYVTSPKEVVINEAVELAKKYSTDKSPKFINGVLADIVKDLN